MRMRGRNIIVPLLAILSLEICTTLSDYHRRRIGENEPDTVDKIKTCKCKGQGSKRLRRRIDGLSFKQCKGFSYPKYIDVKNITISPHPAIVPGNVFINLDFDITKVLPAGIQVNIDVHKYLFNLPFRVLCTSLGQGLRFGSCLYQDLCETITSGFCETLERNGIPCSCHEMKPGRYHFQQPFTFRIPSLNTIFDLLVKGDYIMRAEFSDPKTKVPIGCIEATWSVSKLHKKRESLPFVGKRRRRRGG